MISGSRTLGTVTGGLLAIAMAPAPAASASTSSATPQVDRCTPAVLQLSLGPAHGAAGSVNQTLRFTNVGDTPCGMVGFPGVSYVTGDAGNQVGAPAARTGRPGTGVVLHPGQRAHSDVSYTVTQNYPDSRCAPTHVRGIRVYPPNDHSALYVPRPTTGCANSEADQLQVSAVRPGPGQ